MFRTGGTAEGITSGLAPRQGYATNENNLVKPSDTSKTSMMGTLQTQKSILEALAPRQPRKDRSMRDFLINFGLDIASRPPSGSIFSTAAESAKGPFQQYQAKKFQEEQSDRDLISQLVKGMNDD